jgi:lysozyme
MANVIGEDRSSFQAVTGWAGDAFAFMKAAEGTGWQDPAFPANWANAKSEGKVRGAYHFFHPAADPIAQARFFWSVVSARGVIPGDVFIADVEITVGAEGKEDYGTGRAAARAHLGLHEGGGGLTAASVGPAALSFLNEVRRLSGGGHRYLLYTDLSMAQSVLAGCTAYPLWLAYYAASPPASVAPWTAWTFWQDGKTWPGGGDVDYFNGDEAALLAWAGGTPGNWTEDLVNALPVLQLGAKDSGAPAGWFVHRLQNMVAGYGRWNGLGTVTAIAEDGVFGLKTKAAVAAVQQHAGNSVDGIAGRDTWTVLIG